MPSGTLDRTFFAKSDTLRDNFVLHLRPPAACAFLPHGLPSNECRRAHPGACAHSLGESRRRSRNGRCRRRTMRPLCGGVSPGFRRGGDSGRSRAFQTQCNRSFSVKLQCRWQAKAAHPLRTAYRYSERGRNDDRAFWRGTARRQDLGPGSEFGKR